LVLPEVDHLLGLHDSTIVLTLSNGSVFFR
jgi:hypothetical protein